MQIGFSGARSLTAEQKTELYQKLLKIPVMSTSDVWHVGDADGVDQLVRQVARERGVILRVYESETRQPWALQQRSKRMVDAVAREMGQLIAYPNKPCPEGLTPQQCNSWQGSGTWGTIAYAKRRSLLVNVQPLLDVPLPDWLNTHQISLL